MALFKDKEYTPQERLLTKVAVGTIALSSIAEVITETVEHGFNPIDPVLALTFTSLVYLAAKSVLGRRSQTQEI